MPDQQQVAPPQDPATAQHQADLQYAQQQQTARVQNRIAAAAQPTATPNYVPGTATVGGVAYESMTPDLSILSKPDRKAADVAMGQKAAEASQAAGSKIENLDTAIKVLDPLAKILTTTGAIGTGTGALVEAGVPIASSLLGGALLNKVTELGSEGARQLGQKVWGPNHPIADFLASMAGGLATGALAPTGIGVVKPTSGASGTAAGATETPAGEPAGSAAAIASDVNATTAKTGLTPAVKMVGTDGTPVVVKGNPGELHADIFDRLPVDEKNPPLVDLGFVDKEGNYLTRAQASQAVGAKDLHSWGDRKGYGARDLTAAAPSTAPAAENAPAVEPATAAPVGRYHGTSTPISELRDDTYSSQNIYGQGFYTTDNFDVAQGYGKKGRGGQATIYNVKENKAANLLDLDKTPPKAVQEIVNNTGTSADMGDFFKEHPQATLRQWYDDLRAESGPGTGISADDVQESFAELQWKLEREGYSGLTHIGGQNKTPHQVNIYWNPKQNVEIGQELPPSGGAPPNEPPTGTAAPVTLSQQAENETPQAAVNSLAERQRGALKIARVGKSVAKEFGVPEVATKVPEQQTIDEAQKFLEGMQLPGEVLPPVDSAQTAAKVLFHKSEVLGLQDEAKSILAKQSTGVDITNDVNAWVNRYSANATSGVADLLGKRSEAGRQLEILSPLKPDNAFISQAMSLAQRINIDTDPLKMMYEINNLTPEGAGNMARRVAETAAAGNPIHGAVMEYYKANLLSNTRTVVRIPVENAITTLMEIPIRAIASVMPFGGNDPVAGGEFLAMTRGLKDGFRESVDYAIASFKSGEPEFSKEIGSPFIGRPPAITAENLGFDPAGPIGTAIDYIGTAIRVPYRAVTAAHQFGAAMAQSVEEHALAYRWAVNEAKQAGLSGRAASQAIGDRYASLLDKRPPELATAAAPFRDLVTMNKELGPFGQWLSKGTKFPGANLVVPFFKVYANMTKYGSYYLGSGVLNPWGDVYARGASGQIARARLAAGSFLAGITAYETLRGNLTGDLSYMNPTQRKMAEDAGMQPYAAHIGHEWLQLPNVLRFPMGIVSTAVEQMHHLDDPTADQYAMAATLGVSHALTSSTVVLGLKHVLDLIENPESLTRGQSLEKFIGQTLEGFVPFSGALSGIAKTIDPAARDTRADTPTGPDRMGTVLNELKSRFPIASESLPLDTDVFGRQQVRMPGVPNNLIFPFNVTKDHLDPLTQELIRVGASFPQAPKAIGGPLPGEMDDPMSPEASVPLSVAQQRHWAELRGERLQSKLQTLVDSARYQAASDSWRKAKIEHIDTEEVARANRHLLHDDPELKMAVRARRQAIRAAMRAPASDANTLPNNAVSAMSQ